MLSQRGQKVELVEGECIALGARARTRFIVPALRRRSYAAEMTPSSVGRMLAHGKHLKGSEGPGSSGPSIRLETPRRVGFLGGPDGYTIYQISKGGVLKMHQPH